MKPDIPAIESRWHGNHNEFLIGASQDVRALLKYIAELEAELTGANILLRGQTSFDHETARRKP